MDIEERVAIEVMGYVVVPFNTNIGIRAFWAALDGKEIMMKGDWQPSKRIDQAWMVVEKMEDRLFLYQTEADTWCASFDENYNDPKWIEADTAPIAICLAALKTKGNETK